MYVHIRYIYTFYCHALLLRTNNSLSRPTFVSLFPTRIDRRILFAILIARKTIIVQNFELGIYCIYRPPAPRPRLASRAQTTQNNCHTINVWQAREPFTGRGYKIANLPTHETRRLFVTSRMHACSGTRIAVEDERRSSRAGSPFPRVSPLYLLPLVVARRADCRRAFGNTHIASLARTVLTLGQLVS